jgi:hypothetical protein
VSTIGEKRRVFHLAKPVILANEHHIAHQFVLMQHFLAVATTDLYF